MIYVIVMINIGTIWSCYRKNLFGMFFVFGCAIYVIIRKNLNFWNILKPTVAISLDILMTALG